MVDSNNFTQYVINGRVKRGTWMNKENHNIYASWLGEKLGYQNTEDWYKITSVNISDNYGGGLISGYYKTTTLFVKAMFPNYKWVEWKFEQIPKKLWKDIKNHKIYAIWLGETLGYKQTEDWYKITGDKISNNCGRGLLTGCYADSPSLFVKNVFPHYKWLEWKFGQTPKHFWEDIKNQKTYTKWLGEELGYKNTEDWYDITLDKLIKYYGGGLVSNYYSNSPISFVKAMFPDYEWLEQWRFGQTPKHFWEDIKNQKMYANWLGERLCYKNTEDWYNITGDKINDNGGCGLLSDYYHSSPSLFVTKMFPGYEWLEWKFGQTTPHFWEDIKNQKKYTKWLGEQLGYKNMEDWYDITYYKINNNCGGGLMVLYYNGSPSLFIKTMFPDYEWLEWKFGQTSQHFWKNIENQKTYTIWLGEQLGYKNMEDWYDITWNKICDNCGNGLVSSYYNDSPLLFVKAMFPNYEWIVSKFKKNYSQGQIEWLEYIKVSVPDIRHILNHDGSEFIIPNSRYKADGFSIKDNMIFEYHGDFFHGNPKIYTPTDINTRVKKTHGELYENTLNKQQFCEKSGFKYKFIWESEWIRGKNALIILQKKIKWFLGKSI